MKAKRLLAARKRPARGKQISARAMVGLNAINEAIVRSDSAAEAMHRVCAAAVEHGDFVAAAVFLAGPDQKLHFIAGAGCAAQTIKELEISTDERNVFGQGPSGIAFRTCRPQVNNNYHDDKDRRPWIEFAKHYGIRASASVPILDHGKSRGVLLFCRTRPNSIDAAQVCIMERMSENIAFALRAFERHDASRIAKRAAERHARMFAALSATNETIFRSQTVAEMLQHVCEGVVGSGKCLITAIAMINSASPVLTTVAAAGVFPNLIQQMKVSADPDHIYGQGIGAIALRTGAPCYTTDIMNDPRLVAWRSFAEQTDVHSAAAIPLIRNDTAIGVMHFFLDRETGELDDQMLALMLRLAENVAFGIEMFERRDNNTRLSRMFAALNATNEAILRATTREELFTLVCNAAVEGAKFCSTGVFLAEPEDDYFTIAAIAGPRANAIRHLKNSPREDQAEGHGLSGIAYRSGTPAVMNDYLNDARAAFFRRYSGLSNAQSGAALPLISKGRIIGVLVFMSFEKNTFTPEFVQLLQRLADNVSFALDNFDRADEKRQADERIRYLATHDALTGLPNRATFNQRLGAAIEAAKRDQTQLAVLFIDLDRFKIVNDSLGHAAGDKLLIKMGERLKSTLSNTDVIARLGGDEFVVILHDVADQDQVATVARHLLSVLSEPLTIGDQECLTTASVGVSMFPRDGSDQSTLTRHADMAMYLAKEDGKNEVRFFDRQTRRLTVDTLVLESQLRHALELRQFSLDYQPKVNIASGRITGVEALLRWHHPDLGEVPPAKFIPLAEETGLIVSIGRWVLRSACLQNVAWQRQGGRPISMAVNLSPRQFRDKSLLQSVDEILAESGMRPDLLQLEVTESMVMLNVESAIELLDAIQSRGVRLAIDDFGTGYSSMSIMKRFPIDTIKIDRSFVRDLPWDSEDKAITEAIIQLGRALSLTVVAEGVETEAQQQFLSSRGCDEMQGYLFSRPVAADAIPALIHQTWTRSPPLQPLAEDQPLLSAARA